MKSKRTRYVKVYLTQEEKEQLAMHVAQFGYRFDCNFMRIAAWDKMKKDLQSKTKSKA